MRSSFDLSPLFRSTIGFDRLSQALDGTFQGADAFSYPPYNIEKLSEDDYQIVMAVAGFEPEDVEIVFHESTLTVRGKAKLDDQAKTYLYRGIAGRAFERKFQLADYIQVVGANLSNGLLHVTLKREVPEALRPRTIEIAKGTPQQIEKKKAA
ncbi:MAG: Hsp20 family protein [Alphaproteobacteria bacterium]